ncbi:MAG: ABC transporter ATP-binding protein, partial [Anaerolineae bacterium]|nr:ABC transporter ATP-binding protein [Anaerolineae bacterium]
MQAAKPQPGLVRAIRYLGGQRRAAILAYGALIIASLAQLAVPELTQNMIDAVTNGLRANSILDLPAQAQQNASRQLGISLDQLRADQSDAERLLITAAAIIVIFAVIRGVFSFVQAYMAEAVSQGIAFDFRNEIFAKIQRLSFSYHDRHQTGQL